MKNGRVEIQAIGAGAVNQTMKAIIIARSFVITSGINLICIPAFANVEVENDTKTGMKFILRGER